ncbi:L-aspartate oxidase [Paeniglutamicibacter cryotolerans]|uniref:L-aspartate oxidase n=1 Tax=Paeniglutamicibacter cryotolerans TaxID=670079 RepID=A0A839QKU4_9MICC|nr:L-aspartate oxidase [Paeniglutamicibacter cryotolerans]MBB2996440.1 L-aspartate oxidase [Paeniglutamicibacter cryotolerans]
MSPGSLLIVGSGIAGLYAAVTAAARGHRTTLLTKDRLRDSNTWYAQGGIAAVGPLGASRGDAVAHHVADTLTAGAGLNDETAVRRICAGAWAQVQALSELGAGFDTAPEGEYALGLEAAHSHARILHAHGDGTGRALAGALITACRSLEAAGKLEIRENAFVSRLLTDGHRVTGVQVLSDAHSHAQSGAGFAGTGELHADAVLLATGGIGQLYAATTNPAGATGDGVALAWEAGALVADAEFVQFHPTLVPAGRFMISEAVRGEGAVLIDGTGTRFMQGIHPDAELAPRDVVARAIHRVRSAGGAVYLDATAVERREGPGFLARRFPGITAALGALGHDLALAPVPVAPAQHYWMGGIHVDDAGRTTVPGLLAAGECSNTGVHGANRLASNSLLEALVYAWRAVTHLPVAGTPTGTADTSLITTHPGPLTPEEATAEASCVELSALQELATAYLGVERTGAELRVAAKQLASWSSPGATRATLELSNLLTVGRIIAHAAGLRGDSIGAHYRLDAPGLPQPRNGRPARSALFNPRTLPRADSRTDTGPTP